MFYDTLRVLWIRKPREHTGWGVSVQGAQSALLAAPRAGTSNPRELGPQLGSQDRKTNVKATVQKYLQGEEPDLCACICSMRNIGQGWSEKLLGTSPPASLLHSLGGQRTPPGGTQKDEGHGLFFKLSPQGKVVAEEETGRNEMWIAWLQSVAQESTWGALRKKDAQVSPEHTGSWCDVYREGARNAQEKMTEKSNLHSV